MEIYSQKMMLSFPKDMVEKLQMQCREILDQETVIVRALRKLIDRLSSIVVAALPKLLQ